MDRRDQFRLKLYLVYDILGLRQNNDHLSRFYDKTQVCSFKLLQGIL